jgi:hypothetical protein
MRPLPLWKLLPPLKLLTLAKLLQLVKPLPPFPLAKLLRSILRR